MRHYETIFIISPELTEEDTTGVIEKFSGILDDAGAVMAKVENWGRKRLAYTVKKFTKGYYVLFNYGAEPEAVVEMERNFKIDDKVIRYLTVRLGDAFDPSMVVVEEPAAEEASEGEASDEEAPEEDAPAEEAPVEDAPAEEKAPEEDADEPQKEAESEEKPEEPKAEPAAPESKE